MSKKFLVFLSWPTLKTFLKNSTWGAYPEDYSLKSHPAPTLRSKCWLSLEPSAPLNSLTSARPWWKIWLSQNRSCPNTNASSQNSKSNSSITSMCCPKDPGQWQPTRTQTCACHPNCWICTSLTRSFTKCAIKANVWLLRSIWPLRSSMLTFRLNSKNNWRLVVTKLWFFFASIVATVRLIKSCQQRQAWSRRISMLIWLVWLWWSIRSSCRRQHRRLSLK